MASETRSVSVVVIFSSPSHAPSFEIRLLIVSVNPPLWEISLDKALRETLNLSNKAESPNYQYKSIAAIEISRIIAFRIFSFILVTLLSFFAPTLSIYAIAYAAMKGSKIGRANLRVIQSNPSNTEPPREYIIIILSLSYIIFNFPLGNTFTISIPS